MERESISRWWAAIAGGIPSNLHRYWYVLVLGCFFVRRFVLGRVDEKIVSETLMICRLCDIYVVHAQIWWARL